MSYKNSVLADLLNADSPRRQLREAITLLEGNRRRKALNGEPDYHDLIRQLEQALDSGDLQGAVATLNDLTTWIEDQAAPATTGQGSSGTPISVSGHTPLPEKKARRRNTEELFKNSGIFVKKGR